MPRSYHSNQGAGRLSTTTTNSNLAQDLMDMVDEHLAWQEDEAQHEDSTQRLAAETQAQAQASPRHDRSLANQYRAWQAQAEKAETRRRGSSGTFVVDWDGEGEVVAFYRGNRGKDQGVQEGHHYHDRSTRVRHAEVRRDERSGLYADRRRRDMSASRYQSNQRFARNDISTHYSTRTNTVRGSSPSTRLRYDYNGDVVHVHHPPTSNSSRVSEYFDLPVESYHPGAPLRISERKSREKELPLVPPPADHVPVPVKSNVLSFVKKVLQKLDGSGILGNMRKTRERKRKEKEKVRGSWVGHGYTT